MLQKWHHHFVSLMLNLPQDASIEALVLLTILNVYLTTKESPIAGSMDRLILALNHYQERELRILDGKLAEAKAFEKHIEDTFTPPDMPKSVKGHLFSAN